MKINFCKMHALGNNFMVLDSIRQKVRLTTELISNWGDRRTGVGFDQLLLVEAHPAAHADFKYRIFNADGSEVEQCGNGARCVARFIFDSGLSKKKILRLQTCNGVISTKRIHRDWITASLNVPDFSPASLPFLAKKQHASYSLTIAKKEISFTIVSIGNPHAVIQVPNVATADVATIGSFLEKNASFPKGVNVGFMEIVSRDTIKLRVWERGVGETPACGSGSCAAVVIAQQQGLLNPKVLVQLTGGELEVEWQGDNTPVYLTGPAIFVYDGVIN